MAEVFSLTVTEKTGMAENHKMKNENLTIRPHKASCWKSKCLHVSGNF